MKNQKAIISSLLLLAGASSFAQSVKPEVVPGELIVKFKESTPFLTRQKICNKLSKVAPKSAEALTIANFGSDSPLVLKVTGSPVAMAEQLSENGDVEYAEPNYIYRTAAVSNDPNYRNGSLWGVLSSSSPLVRNSFGSGAANLWNRGWVGRSDVIVGVIDEGVMVNHEDLRANIWVNTQDPVDGIDNDNNGFVDDNEGWDFFNNDRTVFDGTSDDHGTHCAGTIGAVGGNGRGIAGMSWRVKMIPLKFLGAGGGSTTGAIQAIDYLTNLKLRRGLNIIASSNSWGGGGFSNALRAAIERANAAGILFVAAAGNSNQDADVNPMYPAAYDNTNIISVGAITNTGARSGFSNYGRTTVDIFAPGSGIVSTVPGANNTSAYASYNGTSMATPHVTGAVALYRSYYPSATPAQIRSAILNHGARYNAVNGLCVTGARLNVSRF
jgi:subtilisin family serine protease